MKDLTTSDVTSLLNVTGPVNDIALAEEDTCSYLGKCNKHFQTTANFYCSQQISAVGDVVIL